MYAAGMRSCAIAVHFRPCGFALPLLVTLPSGLPHPPTSWSMVGLRCSGKCTYSTENFSVTGARGGDPWEVAMVTPLYLHFAHFCSLPALLSIGTYPPSLIIAYRQVNHFKTCRSTFCFPQDLRKCLSISVKMRLCCN